ncbi:beta-propeller fold lactonase family protein [Streptomyces sp. NPDC047022]|uniref:YncE family protein n=1 Tax=Streptomyces sp. NPDC047022 TaxID=3155737 RepID=UPI0033C0F006
MAITPNGRFVYVTIEGTNEVQVIDTRTNTVVGSPIPVGARPRRLAITPDGRRVYVTNTDDGTVSVIDTRTNTVVDTITVGSEPVGVAITPGRGRGKGSR